MPFMDACAYPKWNTGTPAPTGLALVSDGADIYVATRISGGWYEFVTGKRLTQVTHWMPLPPRPRDAA